MKSQYFALIGFSAISLALVLSVGCSDSKPTAAFSKQHETETAEEESLLSSTILAMQVTEANARGARLESEKQVLENEKAQLQTDLHQVQSKLGDSQAEVELLTSRVAVLEQENQDLKESLIRCQEELASAKSTIESVIAILSKYLNPVASELEHVLEDDAQPEQPVDAGKRDN
ncbi:MAG TPA: hypothetical protein PKD64_04620 [Pirellulaceae bacterium]|mgnify:CR=1 FL=1|nr:hypothetical protein [Pirellulaceae bacterium]HMO91457.1 hypothetical protein [Pirellulaceae bacterium]HMP69466.1 hypothetical protein [Pirellulaceae bacterium]